MNHGNRLPPQTGAPLTKSTGLSGFLRIALWGPALPIVLSAALSLECVHTQSADETAGAPCDDEAVDNRPHPSIGNFNVYYGAFHNHTQISLDAGGTADQAYRYARCVASLDFFGLSEHDGALTGAIFDSLKTIADSYNADGGFAAFWGYEWTSYYYGHLTVVGTRDFGSSRDTQTQTFDRLCSWLMTQNGFAIFNHPTNVFGAKSEFDHFHGPVCGKIVGMELWNLSKGFTTFYYDDGYDTNDGHVGHFDEALGHGWKIGAAGGFDGGG